MENLNPVQSLSLLDVKDLLKRAWQIYKTRFLVFLGISILPIIFTSLMSFYKSFSPLTIIFGIITILVSIWSGASLLYAVKEREQKIGIKESFTKGWHKFIPYLWISFLVMLIVAGGSILFIIPGIIFAVWFNFATYVLISEDLKGTKALSRSKQLVKGKFKSVIWRFFVVGVISFIILAGISFLFSFFGKTVEDVVSSIISLFLAPFITTYSFLIYEDLKKLKGETI